MEFAELQALLASVFRARGRVFTRQTTAADVPGWDSLRHVTLIMEINAATGLDLSPEDTQALPDVGALFDAIQSGLAAS